ncbi:UNVERIFIED_CONTAM: hypothetical protein GTU68_010666, partial [Idotea baltica]|nr:hypothetical protein [Idotea baltica]
MLHYDVQIIGGAALHKGKVAEMQTGEGKTLVATFPAFLNAIAGKGVHIVTVNDYLARRDSEWMAPIFEFHGITCDCIDKYPANSNARREAYAAGISYGTNNEFGFDYLRDNMVSNPKELVQKRHHFAMIDEVDSVLIDDARTPLIISGPMAKKGDEALYNSLKPRIGQIVEVQKTIADEPLYFTIDEKNKGIELTDKGIDYLTGHDEDQNFFIMPDLSIKIDEIERIHAVNQLLKSYCLFEKDVDYVLMDGKVKIVDEQTGRVMDGRRWSDGLHQAVEAKENVKIEDSTQTYATVTLQNYFRMYHKLAGMTGTAETEAGELWKIYKLDVMSIPTNRPIVRDDMQDKVYKTVREKYNAVADEIVDLVDGGRPVLLGTTSVENSEILSKMLSIRKIKHQVLNAKQHSREADIVAEAGKPGTVTIATNMAGRGTD